MSLEDTDEFPIPVETKNDLPKQDSKKPIIVLTVIMVLSIITAIGLVTQAATADEAVKTDRVEVTTNSERVAAADIQLDDLVEEPTEEQLALMIETDFFSEVGLETDVVNRLDKQAKDALKDLRKNIPQVDLPEEEIEELEDRIEEAQELIDDLDTPSVENISNLADKFRGSTRGFNRSRNGRR